MNLNKKLSAALATYVLVSGSAGAAPVLTEWVFSPVGQGFDGGRLVNEHLDVNGTTFFQLQQTGDRTVAFRQHAVFNIIQADSDGRLFPVEYRGGNITGIYEAYGAGKLGGAFSYGGGSLSLYQNPVSGQYASRAGVYGANLGNLIGEVRLTPGGGGILDRGGAPFVNTAIRLGGRIERLHEGYFYSGSGDDLTGARNLAISLSIGNTFVMSYSDPLRVSEVACEYAGFTGPGCTGGVYQNVPGEHIFLSVNGELKLVDVPEPGSLALFGIAMLGAAAVRRRSAPMH